MQRFTQIHTLTTFPLSNVNREDDGRPKTAEFGGVQRLRISSQAEKRALRVSDVFVQSLQGNLGSRSRLFGEEIAKELAAEGVGQDAAIDAAMKVAALLGKVEGQGGDENGKAKKKAKQGFAMARTKQLAFLSPDERAHALDVARRVAAGETVEKIEFDSILRTADGAVDIALFGRMLAGTPDMNRNAALQAAHLFTTHKSQVQDDYFTALDDLQDAASGEGNGSAYLDTGFFGSGVFYGYYCLDNVQLLKNLGGDRELARKAAECVLSGVATVTPSGKKNAFAHQAFASYVMVETGDRQPRNLAASFFKPVTGDDLMAASIVALERQVAMFDRCYGALSSGRGIMNVTSELSLTLPELGDIVTGAFDA